MTAGTSWRAVEAPQIKWIADGKLVFIEQTEESCHISPARPTPQGGTPCNR